jgi:hypothetical protein
MNFVTRITQSSTVAVVILAVSNSTACFHGWITLQFKELFTDKKPEDIALKDFHSKEAALMKTELDLQHWISGR